MTRALILGVLPLLMTTAAYAQPQDQRMTGTIQAPEVLPGEIGPGISQQPLFTIGELPVRVWTPVSPPYDANANRTGASNPFWAGSE